MLSISKRCLLLVAFLLLLGVPVESTGDAELPTPPAMTVPSADDEAKAFSAERAGFSVRVRDEVIPYRVMGLFVLPGEEIRLQPSGAPSNAAFSVKAEGGTVHADAASGWRWTAPRTPGLHPLVITEASSGEHIRLNAFVLTPFDHNSARLDGYRIGQYQEKPLHNDPIYSRPEGFVQLTEANRDVRIAPHFTLGQFACKQTGTYPQYLLLRERLLLKLEWLLQEANARGHTANTLYVMSGFRTPHYNHSIGNRTSYSRHLYGGAADVFIDTDGDGQMDDLNGDGTVNEADAEVLASIVEDHRHEASYEPFVGGLGIYGPAPHRGPFVHVDARGQHARW